jgi:hypothetical protein
MTEADRRGLAFEDRQVVDATGAAASGASESRRVQDVEAPRVAIDLRSKRVERGQRRVDSNHDRPSHGARAARRAKATIARKMKTRDTSLSRRDTGLGSTMIHIGSAGSREVGAHGR